MGHDVVVLDNIKWRTARVQTVSDSGFVDRVASEVSGYDVQHYHFALTALKLGKGPVAGNSTTSIMHFHGPWAFEGAVEGEY
jgi:hypothetical protein